MLDQIFLILQKMAEEFVSLWPYFVITIPIAVAVQLFGVAEHIRHAFSARPLAAIFLATAAGAFSPLCACSVVPMIASLLIGGVPLAPVMSFWIASPSMDPEIFVLSAGILGWQLAVWRFAATLVLSVGAGLLTHYLLQRGKLGRRIMRKDYSSVTPSITTGSWTTSTASAQNWWRQLRTTLTSHANAQHGLVNTASPACATESPVSVSCENDSLARLSQGRGPQKTCGDTTDSQCSTDAKLNSSTYVRVLEATSSATVMVAKFMALALFLQAIVELHVPQAWIAGLLGEQTPWAILAASLLGGLIYISNLAALPLIGSLLSQGMDPAAALAFLVAGPTLTIPSMAAVWMLVTRRVFALYVGFSVVGAILLGYTYTLLS